MTRTTAEFMARFRGVAPHKVARALTSLNYNINFSGCSKSLLADTWVRIESDHGYQDLKRLTLDQIAARIEELYPE